MKVVYRVLLGIILLGSFYIHLTQAQEVEENFKCLGCHENVVSQENIYQHPPFIQQNCIMSHPQRCKITTTDRY